ncbi:MAG: hypothetical protein U0105_17380 [Candidatus Obscuribacterales bacterium]
MAHVDPAKIYQLWQKGGEANPSFQLEAGRSDQGFDYWVAECKRLDSEKTPQPPVDGGREDG